MIGTIPKEEYEALNACNALRPPNPVEQQLWLLVFAMTLVDQLNHGGSGKYRPGLSMISTACETATVALECVRRDDSGMAERDVIFATLFPRTPA